MNVADKSIRANVSFMRNLLAGCAGLIAAALLVLVVLRLQYYVTTSFLVFSLFIFPVPVACGLAVGLISPRKAIVWAPLWAAIFAVLLCALLAGGLRGAGAILWPWRVAYVAAGVLLAAFAGLMGQRASRHGHGSRVILLFLVLCCGLVYAGNASLGQKMHVFERDYAPSVREIVNRDYIAVPPDSVWTCVRLPVLDSYELSTPIDGSPLYVRAGTDSARIIGLEFDHAGSGQCIEDLESARAYLSELGFRKALLNSLSKWRGAKCSWCASLDGTRLTVNRNGDVRMKTIVPFADEPSR